MKTKFFLFFMILSIFVACSSDEENESKSTGNDSANNSENDNESQDNSLPDAIFDDSENETPDKDTEKTSEHACLSDGVIIHEGGQQFIVCPDDNEKFQKQLCQNGHWINDGECTVGSVTISAGSFKMGCDKELEKKCPKDTEPLHEVALSSYVMDKFEVPVELFEKCIEEKVCTNENAEEPHYRTSSDSYQCNIGNKNRKNHPANCVTWFGAKAYCEWLGRRLPTEAEWEYAAKSGQNQIYPWGDTPIATCENNVMFDKDKDDGCGHNSTFPIGSKPNGASAQGIYDLSGNVAEYTNDWYEKNFYSTEDASQKDPKGPAEPETDKSKVVRGGSYINGDDRARSSFRSSTELNKPDINFGFRCVTPAE